MNSIVLDGRVVRESEYKKVGSNETPLLEFTIANETGYGDYKKSHFFKCKVWGKRATGLKEHIVKGKPLFIRGEMEMSKWQATDGSNRYSWEVNVAELSFHMKDSQSTATPTPDTFNDDIPF
jgi:single-strand DNA-binding protein